jgi:hypothetical protein
MRTLSDSIVCLPDGDGEGAGNGVAVGVGVCAVVVAIAKANTTEKKRELFNRDLIVKFFAWFWKSIDSVSKRKDGHEDRLC